MSELQDRVMHEINKHVIEIAGPNGTRCHGWIASSLNAAWPIIEAELQKRDQEAEMLRAIAKDADNLRWEEANKLLEQTIEVLGAAPEVDNAGRECCEDCDWWLDKAKPLLDKLQALKKEGTE